MSKTRGFSLVESLAALALVGLALAIALPSARSLLRRGRLEAGTRELASTLQAQRWRTVATACAHGLSFEVDETGWHWSVVRDGNGNGLRRLEIAAGVDRTVSGPHRLEHSVRGVTPGIPRDRTFPAIPPGNGTLDSRGDPVRFGRSNLIAFGPLGTSSSGTVYLTDGFGGLSAISVFGPTARVRIWHFRAASDSWIRR